MPSSAALAALGVVALLGVASPPSPRTAAMLGS